MIISVGVSKDHSIILRQAPHRHAFHSVTLHSVTQYRYGVECDGVEFSLTQINYTMFTFALINNVVHIDQARDFLQIELFLAKLGSQLYNLPDKRSGVV